MTERPTLHGQLVTLRPPYAADQADRLRVGYVPEYVHLCGGEPDQARLYTAQDAAAWYERIDAEPYGWAMEAEGRCVGLARLHTLDEENRRARYAIGIFDPAAWGRGYGAEATRLVLRYGFETLGLHRVDLRVIAYNERAIACYAKCGFVHEGIEREGALIGGQWHSDVMMSILEHEYRTASQDW
jgi:[ribosomal protein S5]-alanine N-acetyltransferase